MKNNLCISQSSDILDFLDKVRFSNASQGSDNFDIVDAVKDFLGKRDYRKAYKMSENVKSLISDESRQKATLSRMTRMSDFTQDDIDKYQYLYEERAAIIQFDSLPITTNKDLAELEALKEIKILYATDKKLDINCTTVTSFINKLKLN
ncbi:MAG: hypothetical protein KGQ36_04205 [Rickettsiales bacterium]|nr:hypothetical protein [Rickettsiales bacterium]